jgi:small redox-active disulfide protein 2
MNIKVIGSGCATCEKLHDLTTQAVQELGMKDEVEYGTDVNEIVAMGLMQSPVLAIDGKPALVGKVFDLEKIKGAIQKAAV